MSDLIKIDGSIDRYLFFGLVAIIPTLILGPAIPDFIIATSSILFLIYKSNNFDFIKYKNYSILFLVFYCLIVLSSLISDHQLFSLKSSFFYVRFYLYFLVVCYLIEKYFFVFRYLFIVSVSCFIILLIDTLFQFSFKFNLLGYSANENGHRIASLFKDEYILGTFIMRIFPIILFCIGLFKLKKKFTYILFYSVFFASGLIIMLSGDRTPLLLFGIYLFLYFFSSNDKQNIIIVLFSFIIFFSLILYTSTDIKKRFLDQTIVELGLSDKNPGYFFEKKGLFFFSPQHENLFKTSLNIFHDNKLIGIGPNNFRNTCENKKYKVETKNHYNCYNHPHNFYIQILAECGMIVFLLFCLFYLNLIKHYLSQLKKNFNKKENIDNFVNCLIVSVLVNLFPLAPTGNFFNNNLSMFNFLSIALFFSYLKNKKLFVKNLNKTF